MALALLLPAALLALSPSFTRLPPHPYVLVRQHRLDSLARATPWPSTRSRAIAACHAASLDVLLLSHASRRAAAAGTLSITRAALALYIVAAAAIGSATTAFVVRRLEARRRALAAEATAASWSEALASAGARALVGAQEASRWLGPKAEGVASELRQAGGALAAEGVHAALLSALACEAAQFALATSTCWLLGLGYATPPHSLAKYSRLLSASALAVRSRVVTRPFRLLVELYLVPPIMKRIRALPPQRRRNAVSLAASSIVAALLALITAIQLLDLAFVAHTRSSAPPAALLIGSAYHHLVRPIRRAIDLDGDGSLEADELISAVSRFCAWAGSRLETTAALIRSLAVRARTVTPVRALLDLCEIDDFILGVWRSALRKIIK
mmetsp:Transcript_41998/g.104492  ORF Transcript_41998/g.104492 Transcript_41998/m.104492 type:complete len:384 (+) Transcript_41998:18-1169(+)